MESEFPKLEEEILNRWRKQDAFAKSLEKRKKSPRFVFYEGPPTANGSPGIHHVLTRSFKDVVCRYKTMRGFFVERKAGWDTHGLPVELQVEKKLGLKNKKDIEKYGIAKFNKACRESVWEYKKEWEELTERIGFWLDQKNPYITYTPEYMETLWQIIKKFSDKKLLYKDYKVVPYCSRCGTAQSSHEVAQGYKTVKDKSVYAKFALKGKKNTYFLAWTTTPWTLPGNVALAVGSKIKYVFAEQNGATYILAENLLKKLDGEYKVVKEVLGKELEGMEYEPVFDSLKKQPEKKHYVVLADFVSTEDGTGIVHTAVMYGEDDYALGQKYKLPKQHTVDEAGKFNDLVPQWKGVFVKAADAEIIEDLEKRNLLYKEELYEHEYPFCWRCSTPLLYYAKDSWFVNMQKVKKQLIANNNSVNWVPDYIKKGRMGEWLSEVKDWAFSRERYWGTPLPVWKCTECEHQEVIGSREELAKHTTFSNTYHILRHGESIKNKTNTIANWPETTPYPLTKKGEEQAKKAAKKLKTKKIDIIVASDLLRTKQTAGIVAEELGLKVEYDKLLREASMGIFNNQNIDKFWKYFEKEGETEFDFFVRRFTEGAPKGETFVDIQKRMFELIKNLEKKYQGKTILLVSHELPLTLLEGVTKGLTREELIWYRMNNAVGTGETRKIEASLFPYAEDMQVDLHRPYIDDITFECKQCNKGKMQRVKDVVDVWFDSGAMPYAQNHWMGEKKPAQFPADYIVEGIDQTRGWFYTLLAEATLLGFKAPYKNALSLGHILDEKGEKMSKSKGNIVNPWEMVEKYGVDTLRWYFYTYSHPGEAKAFVERDLQQTMRKFMMTLWNSFVFYETYAQKTKTRAPKHALDKWILSRLHSTNKEMTKRMDAFDITGAARTLDSFVINDLSLWYIRRSRQRFQNPKTKAELQEASAVLGEVLLETSKLAAPFAPFMAEHIYGKLQNEKNSVHWEDWPKFSANKINVKLEKEMEQVRDLVAKGLAERAKASMKVRQPLQSFRVKSKTKLAPELTAVMREELNVKEVEFVKTLKSEVELNTELTPELKEEGLVRELIRTIQGMRKKAGYQPKDKAVLFYEGGEEFLKKHATEIKTVAGLKSMDEGKPAKADAQEEFSLEEKQIALGIKKA